MKYFLGIFDLKQPIAYRTELFAGFTVAMTMIPESLSFALLAGFPPLMGLYAAFIMGLVTAVFGGRPGLISGGAGATVIVLIALMKDHGLEYVLAAVVLAGVIQLIIGLFKLGKFIRLVPRSVMFGFVNGLAIVIFLSQIEQFKWKTEQGSAWMTGTSLWIMLGLVALTIALVYFIPKITRAVPSSLVAIAAVFALVYFSGIDTKKVVDIASVSGHLPTFKIPDIPFNFETLQIIFPYALVMAMVGLIEGLLTLNLVDEITETKGNSNRECIAQGGANILNGFFFGMGGCPMIAQTMVNISAGSRTRLSGIIAACTILLIILVGAPVIEQVPIAALTGVMIFVAIGTFEWATFKTFGTMPKTDVFVILVVTAITVFLHNLALAVFTGVIIAALVFAWDNAKRIRARKYTDDQGVKHYEIYGPLFFGSTELFAEKFDVATDPVNIVIDFSESRIADMSAIESLQAIVSRYEKLQKQVKIKGVSADCERLLHQAKSTIQIEKNNDLAYSVME